MIPVRDRTVVLSGLILITALAWAYMWYLARDPMAMCMANMQPWGAADLLATFAMWAVMMVAMMVPSASPMILAFAGVNRMRRERSLPYVPTAAFLMGYLAVWTGFSALATVAEAALHSAALLSPMMVSTSAVFGGILLLAAGAFQWTPLKNACLRHCRSPLGFILTEWRGGAWGAVQMGVRHGAYCVGCCWLLMALLFVAGVMNLWWIAAIGAFVLIEKVTRAGPLIARATGVLLMLWGVWMLGRVLA
jgi:predicted metal-binding membrane protein